MILKLIMYTSVPPSGVYQSILCKNKKNPTLFRMYENMIDYLISTYYFTDEFVLSSYFFPIEKSISMLTEYSNIFFLKLVRRYVSVVVG